MTMRFSSFFLLMLYAPIAWSDCSAAKDTSKTVIAGGSLTEIVYFLEEEEKIIGVDVTSNFPKATSDFPSIGYVRALSTEGILSLKPTLILGDDDMGPPLVIEQLSLTGLDVRILEEDHSSSGILKKIECLSKVLDTKANDTLAKIDLVKENDLEQVKKRIRQINPFAKIINTTKCGVPLNEILDLDAFSLKRVLEVEPDFLESDHDHEHDDDVTSISFVSDTPLDMEKFQTWFSKLLQTKGQDILRTKGILDFTDETDRYVFQGVHMLMDASPMGKWPEGKKRTSRLVFIGRNLESMNLKEGFENCKSA